jgi:hypothetical protein
MKRFVTLVLFCFAAATDAAAAEISVPSALTGTYNKAGGYSNSAAHQNYRVGLSPITTTPEHRNFFIFDLTSYPPVPPGDVTGVALKLYLPKAGVGVPPDPGMGYISPDPTEIYTVTATAPPVTLEDPIHSMGEAIMIFDSLGTGPLAGEIEVSAADNGTFVTIPLVPGVAAAVNGLLGSGRISMGGRIKTFDGTHIDELLFAFTDLELPHMVGKSPMLVITTVPEPGVAVLLLAMSCAAVCSRRPRNVRQS